MNIDQKKVLHAARNGIPLVIVTHTLPPQTEAELESILGMFLNELGQGSLRDHLSYCLRELTGNAKKANTKRVYFEEKGWNLEDPAQYEQGMKSFKTDTLGDIQRYLDLQEKKNLAIKVAFLIRNHVLYLSVRNTAAITSKEMTRVFDRVARSRAFESMAEAFEEVLDDSEGAGLGIVILLLMLRKMGLTEKSFDLTVVGTETSASLTIPMEAVRLDKVALITDELVDTIDSLPPFPDNLTRLVRLLEDPEVDMDRLARQLGRDPGMTADLLKFINSAQMGRRQRIESLNEAVRIVGIDGLKNLAYSFGAHRLLQKYLAKQKPLWDDAMRVSFYAGELMKLAGGNRKTVSRAQLGGILSNLGQIILTFLHPDQSARILNFCRIKSFSVELFNELTQSINPTEVAGRIAEKWNFPDDLVQILRNQNQPASAQPGLQPVIAAVHLAANLVAVEQDLLLSSQINQSVLKSFRLDDLLELEAYHGQLQEKFGADLFQG